MRDKSLDIFLMVIFSISGAVVLILAWIQPMTTAESILAIFIGLGGLFIASTRAKLFKLPSAKRESEPISVKVRTEKNIRLFF